ncbi:MAG: triacylglycerol lipase [Solirubrobacteraceae bacterium]|nr:triacylglycerol lipase [Solirubrobacteraceae bacterium]
MAALERFRIPLEPGVEGTPSGVWWGRHWAEVRWQAQFAQLLVDPLFRGHGVPRGDGRPVVLIPGFLAGDYTLGVLGGWLSRIGYESRGSGIRFNVDCFDRGLDRLEERVEGLRETSGRRVALVGHSRGGHFAKALASRRPEWISHVVSMGAGLDEPFAVSAPIIAVARGVGAVHGRRTTGAAPAGCMTSECGCRAFRDYRAPFPAAVPLTSIYSRSDGCLRWQSCVVPYADNVEVGGSHVGLAFERRSYAAIARALAAPERAA